MGEYQVLAQQNDVMLDSNEMGDILALDGTTLIKSSNDPDFNGVISDGGSGFYVYTNWEDRPGSMSRIQLSGLTSNGYSTINQQGMLDFSSVDGTWVNCFGTVSPWNTPLSAEESTLICIEHERGRYPCEIRKWYPDLGRSERTEESCSGKTLHCN